MRRLSIALPFAALLLMPHPAFAQVAVADSGDTAWMIVCALLVLLAALPGVMLRHAGFAPVRSVLSVMAQGAGIAAGASLVWAAAGYSLAYAPGGAWLSGGANLMLANLAALRDGMTVPESAFVLFQMALALFAACLIGGAAVGRARTAWMIAFAPLWLLLVYAPVVHWVWGGGWLAGLGVMDFAGGLVLHLCAGFSALALALIAGRRGAGVAGGHSPALGMAGGALIWVGSAGIVGGWAMGATDDAATAILNSHFAACSGALTWALIDRAANGRASASGFVSGALSGLAAGAASAALAGTGGAMLVGLIAAALGRVCVGVVGGANDPARLFAVHGVGGLTGALALPVLVLPVMGGVGFEGSISFGSAMLSQAMGAVVVALWATVGTAIAALTVALALPVQPEGEEEADGPDLHQHGEQAWNFR